MGIYIVVLDESLLVFKIGFDHLHLLASTMPHKRHGYVTKTVDVSTISICGACASMCESN